MTFIEPLALETWFNSVLSGSLGVFTALSIFAIFGLAAYFRMTLTITFLLFGMFLLMFNEYIDISMYFVLISIGGLLIGYWVSKIPKN